MAQKIEWKSANSAGNGSGMMFGNPAVTKRGLLVVHEWWGMTDQIQEEGQMIADQGGFTVIVPDFYRGKTATNHEDAGHLMSGLDFDGAVADIAGASAFLREKGCTKVGITGFCMGGILSFVAAGMLDADVIAAAAPFYGLPALGGKKMEPYYSNLKTIKVPVEAHWGDEDEPFPLPVAEELKKELLAAGVNYTCHVYPGAKHAFTNPTSPGYHAEHCKTALQRMYAFMQKHLGQDNHL